MYQIPYENNLSSFNLSNERIIHLLYLLIVFIFLYHVTFSLDMLVGIFAVPMVLSSNFCLGQPFKFST